ncbi:caspase-3-like [Anticarsia gemmatalis]|uniref:caspase-3-like n=1 Tax=Anticarsia gemmatalis TaxID=129554 RepID=UPI003F76E70D
MARIFSLSRIESDNSTIHTDAVLKKGPAREKDDVEKTNKIFVPSRIINTRALPKTATSYELENFELNYLLIIEQVHVDGYTPRYGSEEDVKALSKTFENANFTVTRVKDLTKQEIFEVLQRDSNRDFTDYGCIAIVVLTHGSDSGLRAKDKCYNEEDILNFYNSERNPTLLTKPRILIIQACRGTAISPNISVFENSAPQKDSVDIQPHMDHTHITRFDPDVLMLHSTYAGKVSMRDSVRGSWFIQELCEQINSLAATHDLESIVTKVNRNIAIEYQHSKYNKITGNFNINKQMPVMTSTLTRRLFLRNYTPFIISRIVADSCSKSYLPESNKSETNAPFMQEQINLIPRHPSDITTRGRIYHAFKPGDFDDKASTVADDKKASDFDPKSSSLDYLNYLRAFLSLYSIDHPHDEAAKVILELAVTLQDGNKYKPIIQKMNDIISEHLKTKAQNWVLYEKIKFSAK